MGTDSRVFEPLLGALGAVVVASPRARAILDRAGPAVAAAGAAGLLLSLALIRPVGTTYYRGGALFVAASTLAVVASLWRGSAGPIGSTLA